MSACGSSKRKRKGSVPHKNWKGSDSLERVTKTAVTIEEESGEAGGKGVEFTRTDVKDKPHMSPQSSREMYLQRLFRIRPLTPPTCVQRLLCQNCMILLFKK